VYRPSIAVVALLLCAAVLAGCTTRRPAPVVDRTAQAKPAAPSRPAVAAPRTDDTRPEFYVVRRGDTLYSIALDHGVDYRELALWNGIDNPGALKTGQRLRLRPPQGAATASALKTAPRVDERPLGGAPGEPPGADGRRGVKAQPQAVRVPYSEQAYARMAGVKPEVAAQPRADAPESAGATDGDEMQFTWPASGKVISSFYDGGKGIGISGKPGQPVYASAPGRVIFSGTGIRGFGKLIVIKHNNTFLSVYGHNNELLVKEGQNVTKGQKIAEMGNTDTDQVKLHFEIRRYGKPVDPIKLLPERRS
jgi:lipoprotein NlpD